MLWFNCKCMNIYYRSNMIYSFLSGNTCLLLYYIMIHSHTDFSTKEIQYWYTLEDLTDRLLLYSCSHSLVKHYQERMTDYSERWHHIRTMMSSKWTMVLRRVNRTATGCLFSAIPRLAKLIFDNNECSVARLRLNTVFPEEWVSICIPFHIWYNVC